MSTSSPTRITVFLNPEDEEHALYLIGESFPPTTFTIIDTQEEHVTWGSVFVLTHQEKRLTLALSAPATVGADRRYRLPGQDRAAPGLRGQRRN